MHINEVQFYIYIIRLVHRHLRLIDWLSVKLCACTDKLRISSDHTSEVSLHKPCGLIISWERWLWSHNQILHLCVSIKKQELKVSTDRPSCGREEILYSWECLGTTHCHYSFATDKLKFANEFQLNILNVSWFRWQMMISSMIKVLWSYHSGYAVAER